MHTASLHLSDCNTSSSVCIIVWIKSFCPIRSRLPFSMTASLPKLTCDCKSSIRAEIDTFRYVFCPIQILTITYHFLHSLYLHFLPKRFVQHLSLFFLLQASFFLLSDYHALYETPVPLPFPSNVTSCFTCRRCQPPGVLHYVSAYQSRSEEVPSMCISGTLWDCPNACQKWPEKLFGAIFAGWTSRCQPLRFGPLSCKDWKKSDLNKSARLSVRLLQ